MQRYDTLHHEIESLITHLSDVKRKPSAAVVKRIADLLTQAMLEGGPILQVLAYPDDVEVRMRTLRHLLKLEAVIGRKRKRSQTLVGGSGRH